MSNHLKRKFMNHLNQQNQFSMDIRNSLGFWRGYMVESCFIAGTITCSLGPPKIWVTTPKNASCRFPWLSLMQSNNGENNQKLPALRNSFQAQPDKSSSREEETAQSFSNWAVGQAFYWLWCRIFCGAQKLETFLPWSWVQWKMEGVCPIVVAFQKIQRHFPVNHEYGRTGKMEPAIKSCLKIFPRNPCLDRKLLRAQFWRTDCLMCIGNRAQWQTKCSSSTTIFYFKILAKLATRFMVQISGKNDRWIIATFFGQFYFSQTNWITATKPWHDMNHWKPCLVNFPGSWI